MSRTFRHIRKVKSWLIFRKFFGERPGIDSPTWNQRPREYYLEQEHIGNTNYGWGIRKTWRRLASRRDRHLIKDALRHRDIELYYKKHKPGDDGS